VDLEFVCTASAPDLEHGHAPIIRMPLEARYGARGNRRSPTAPRPSFSLTSYRGARPAPAARHPYQSKMPSRMLPITSPPRMPPIMSPPPPRRPPPLGPPH